MWNKAIFYYFILSYSGVKYRTDVILLLFNRWIKAICEADSGEIMKKMRNKAYVCVYISPSYSHSTEHHKTSDEAPQQSHVFSAWLYTHW